MDEMNTMNNTQDTVNHDVMNIRPQDMTIDDKAVKKMAGEAIARVEGVLGVSGGLTDVLKSGNDYMTKGLTVTTSNDGQAAEVSAKIITEYGRNIPEIVNNVQEQMAETLKSMAGLTVTKVEVEVTDTITRDEYEAKSQKNPMLS